MDSKRNRSTGDLYKYGTRGSEEYTKLTETLMLAKQRRRKLEENLRILREMQGDKEAELSYTTREICRLETILHSMGTKKRNSESGKDSRRLFVSKLDSMTTEKELDKYFGRFGKIVSVKVCRIPFTNEPRGFGYIEYQHDYMADKALEEKPHFIRSRKIDSCLANAKRNSLEGGLKRCKHE